MYETEQEIEKVILVAVCSNPNQDPEDHWMNWRSL